MVQLENFDLLQLVRRLPKRVVAILKANPGQVFVAGGYVRSVIANEQVNDIDLFTSSPQLAKELATKLGEEVRRKPYETDNAYTVRMRGPAVQFIHKWSFNSPQDCIASFDFTIAAAAFWWKEGNKVETDVNGTHFSQPRWESLSHPQFYAHLAAKRLVYRSPIRNEEAGGSMLRVLKFYQRGYRIPIDSLGAVIARLVGGIKEDGLRGFLSDGLSYEQAVAKVLTGLLHEVDPQIDPDHIAHLPAEQGQ